MDRLLFVNLTRQKMMHDAVTLHSGIKLRA